MIQPQEIDDLTLAFPASVTSLMPDKAIIPEEIIRGSSKWSRVTSDWFFCGLHGAKWKPREGIDTKKALRHVGAILGSWEPKHEDKEAAVAYLLSEWFEDVSYTKGKP
ncbi:hypothetical protein LCGC14_2727780 [marine sediment metagenome]|uniref:Uncharacterized protein n=1 Tax=marine sediment metagenome TaxID=412755 RepID=A0A0F9BH87_9ZZZZ